MIPIVLDRFRYLILSYAFLRERIVNNNTLSSFEFDVNYGNNLDNLYNDISMQVESKLTDLKVNSNSVDKPILEILKVMDSESFCHTIIGDKNYEAQNSTIEKYESPNFAPGFKPYQG